MEIPKCTIIDCFPQSLEDCKDCGMSKLKDEEDNGKDEILDC